MLEIIALEIAAFGWLIAWVVAPDGRRLAAVCIGGLLFAAVGAGLYVKSEQAAQLSPNMTFKAVSDAM